MTNEPLSKILFNGQNYLYNHKIFIPGYKNFKLHTHNSYEIYIFLKGNAEYVIESKTFPMKPYDILITKNDELHQVRHLEKTTYERIVVEVNDAFFEENDCIEYCNLLKNRKTDTDNIISPDSSDKIKLMECISRIEKYIKESEKFNRTIVKCSIIELLHIINTIKSKNVKIKSNNNIHEIINYINSNISNEIRLDDIANHLFMSKYHLCRIFKEHTGLTINKYITNKRIKLVQNLYAEGYSLSTACIKSGYASYSSFYKAYISETGKSPKNNIENYNLINEFEIQE